jgi:single-stranded DNA-binding protein
VAGVSITALITGKLIADPEVRTSDRSGGKPYTLARVAAATDEGSALVSVVAFGTTGEQLAALAKGDTVALTGKAKPTAWQGRSDEGLRAGLSLVADNLLTAYHLRRKRQAMQAAGRPAGDEGAEA